MEAWKQKSPENVRIWIDYEAAHALYAALKGLVDALYRYGVGKSVDDITPFVREAQAAIAEAEGGDE